ncbi:YdbH domain-containing protein [Sphingomonas sp. RP10(2022)]|uniref:YdbH domain-containing protein n=1 Tax=Sphingomonas liriopis TaxID=2949094 RepID=A0A9X2HPU5_9SPHN|nr:YdbH domain-containing protein [Sphingomonas liriopis]MCP3734222.1 YdbH domain-containing protein [Sphingomonas liriopis]
MAEGADQSGETPSARRPRIPRFGWPARIVLAIALVLLLALLGLWVARKPIAGRVIDAELGKRGVVARYGISDLGFGRQRLTDVVIGDPAAPDLVADWLETQTQVGFDGPTLTGVRAGNVRLRGRLVDGALSLGELDKLMPPPSGKPFALPALRVDVADARVRLETPSGVLGLKIAGKGRLDDGFAGTVALAANRVASAGCAATQVRAALRVTIADAAPRLAGPVRVAQAACGGATLARGTADLDVRLAPALDGWRGSLRVATGAVRGAGAQVAGLRGTVAFDGSRAATGGAIDLTAARARTPAGEAATLAVQGRYRIGAEQRFAGTVRATDAGVAPAASLDLRGTAQGTPVAPLLAAASGAVRKAAQRFDGSADLDVRRSGDTGQLRVTRATLTAVSGARARLAGGGGLAFGWPDARLRIDGAVAMTGGGLPDARVTLAQARAGAPVRGRAIVAPYAAGGARLALAPVVFTATPGGATRIATRAELSGPLGDGRVDGLAVPLDLRWNGKGTLVANPACVPVAMRRLAVAGLTLDPLRTTLCPLPETGGGAMVTLADGRMTGGVRLPATRLAGRLGQTPLTLAASGAQLRLGARGFVLDGVAARLGGAERVTRIDLAQLTGRIDGGVVAGTFTGGNGQIANVPLLLREAAGDWSLRGATLALAATMTVGDAAPDPRFRTLAARDVALRLADGRIDARGTLYEPTRTVKVADVRIVHALGPGRGTADIAVPGIAFTERFQPDLLTRLTYGVVADVRGSVSGEGHIAWTADGVTSTGTFATRDTALAAAFGPVAGITTTIRFTDLLALESAPAQVASIKTVNPGIAVSDGTITYRLLPDNRVQVDGGLWPFAGGRMTLLPTTLDFSEERARRLTFRLDGVAADQFLQQFDFKNLDATGTFDGELPMVFDIDGGRIENGRLAVRQGGGAIAYVGDLTQKDLGIWGNIAFQALKSLRYRNLTIAMNGPLAGEMVTDVRFAGVTQGQGAKSNFIVRRLQRLPFVFNIRIRAPFRGLLDSAQSFYDPRRLIQRHLPALLERQKQGAGVPIQPPASGTVP